MSRRIALALSFSMTVVVAFAVASLASQAGWLQAKSNEVELASAEALPATETPPVSETIEPLVITEYVYQDIPVVVPGQQVAVPPPTATTAPQPTPTVPTASDPEQIVPASASQSAQEDPRGAPQAVFTSGDNDHDWDDDHDEDEHKDEHEDHEDEDSGWYEEDDN